MTLEISQGDGILDGVFSFDVDGRRGSYRVSGRLLPDGRFNFVPRDWIERPAGFAALSLEGALNPNGRLIEGRLSPCAMSGFKATRALVGGSAAPRQEAPEAVVPGSLTGLWQGGIGCRSNRRGNTETYPLSLQVLADGAGLSAAARVQIYKQRNSGAGPAFEQHVVLSGRTEGGTVMLGNHLLVSKGGAPVDLREITATLGADGNLAGNVRMNGCETVSLARAGAGQPPTLPSALAGLWTGSGGGQGDTAIALHVMAGATPPFVELRATYPASRPQAERDRLRLSLAPVMALHGRVLLAPMTFREATGLFAPTSRPRFHALSNMRGFVIAPAADGTLELHGLSRGEALAALSAGAAGAEQGGSSLHVLARPSSAEAEAIAAGEAPPAALAGTIGGALAAAPSREGQCRVLDAWIQPHGKDVNIDRMGIDAVRTRLTGAFADEVFEPVFGLPLLLTTQDERSSVTELIRSTCARGMGFRLVGFVGDFILGSETQFTGFTALMADRAETRLWIAATEAELSALPADARGLERITLLREDFSRRSREFTPPERSALEASLDRHEASARAGIFLAEARQLPETGFQSGALNSVFRLMDRLTDSRLDQAAAAPIRDMAELKARAILSEPLREAAAVGAALPVSLAGMQEGQAALNRLRPYRAGMDRFFGSIDRDGVLQPLHARLDAIRNDAGVQAAFRAALMQVEPGPDPKEAVMAAAAAYIDPNDYHRAPALAAIVNDAADRSEVRAISVVDLAANPSPGEPTAEEIARFALERVQGVNSEIASLEQACLSGRISDPIQALACLSQPATLTGQKGFGARLVELRKLGCIAEVPGTRYRCTFTQQIRFKLPGGDAFGGPTLQAMAQRLSSGEAVDARFMRAKGGGWNIVWGDLD